MSKKVLIFGTMYLDSQEMTDKVKLWLENISNIVVNLEETKNDSVVVRNDVIWNYQKVDNADTFEYDWILIDSDSPKEYTDQLGIEYRSVDDPFKPNTIISFNDNIGHLSREGKDGWGRAFCKGIELAINNGYEWCFHVESDLIFNPLRNTLSELFNYLKSRDAYPKVFSSVCESIYTKPIETGLILMECDYLKNIDFINKYNWKITDRLPRPEERIKNIFKNYAIAWYGFRANDCYNLSVESIRKCDYLTHCSNKMLEDLVRRWDDVE